MAIAFSGASVAQQADRQVDEVVISGSRSATKLAETPVSIGVVRKEQWEQDKAKSVGEIINRISGVHWNDLGNEQHSMGIRQPISTNNVYQYLEDGIPIRPLGVFNHNALNEMNMNGAGSVEVVKGAASSLYGSNAVGGAVNFLTERASRTPTATAGIRHDSKDGFTRIDTGASNTYGDLGVRFSHYSSKRDHNNWQQYSGGSKDSLTLRGDYVIDSKSWLRASFVQTDLVSDMTGSLFENDYRANPGKSINTFTYRKDKTTRANLAWEGETTKNGLTTVTFFHRNNDHGQLPAYLLKKATNNNTTGTGSINNNHVESIGVDVKHEQNFDWLRSKLVSGIYVDKSQNKYVSDNISAVRDSGTGIFTSYALAPLTVKGVRDYQADISNEAVFSQFELSPVEKLRLVAGGRYDSITYDFVNNKPTATPQNRTDYGSPNETRSFSKLSPKVGATYALGGSASVYSNISDGFVPPEVSQLYSKATIPDLKPASYRSLEVGYRNTLSESNIKLDAALFRMDGKDTIVSYTTAPNTTENRNAGKTRSQGLEFGLSQVTTRFDWRLGATIATHKYLEYRADSTLDYSGKDMSAAPSHIINAQVGYRLVPQARIALGLTSLGSYWMNDLNTVKYAGHDVFSLQGNYDFGQGWEGWMQVRNLFDKAYANTASSSYNGTTAYNANDMNQYGPGSPRSIMVGVTWMMGRK
jgi:outer membrane receptor protein involved in Fe transport